MTMALPLQLHPPLLRSTESDDGRENGNEIVMKVMEMREREARRVNKVIKCARASALPLASQFRPQRSLLGYKMDES